VLGAVSGCTRLSDTGPSGTSLVGPWSGTLGTSMSSGPARVTWTTSQSGTWTYGMGSLSLNSGGATVTLPIALTGPITGSQLQLSLTVGSGAVPGFPSCAIAGAISATATTNAISGIANLTFVSCQGFVALPFENGVALNLTK